MFSLWEYTDCYDEYTSNIGRLIGSFDTKEEAEKEKDMLTNQPTDSFLDYVYKDCRTYIITESKKQ